MSDKIFKLFVSAMLTLTALGSLYTGSTLDYMIGKYLEVDYNVYFNDYVPICLKRNQCNLVIMDTYAYLDMVDGTIIPLENHMLKEGVLRELR